MSQQRTVYTFGAFHYDVAYRKTFEGYLDVSFDAIKGGLRMLDRYPEYAFVIEQVILVREFVNRHPDAEERMRKYAQEGRLVFAPGMFTMPDVNLPNGESFIRNLLIGRDWLMEHMGVEPKICWMADIFGHHAQMPQIAKKCGFIGYMFERGKTNGDDSTFWWEGIDGSRILTQWEVDTYGGLGAPMSPYLCVRGWEWVANFSERMYFKPQEEGAPARKKLLTCIGSDFRKPEDRDMEFIRAYNGQKRPYRIIFASPEKYFEELIADTAIGLPVVKADFNALMQGTFSSRIRIKQANRRLENIIAAVESLETALSLRGQMQAPDSPALWEALTWNAFHDIIAGTLEDNALREALRDFQSAERNAASALSRNFGRCPAATARAVKPGARRVTLFNSLPYEREDVVAIPVTLRPGDQRGIGLLTATGAALESQLVMKHTATETKVLDLGGKEVAGASKPAGASQKNVGAEAVLLAKVRMPAGSVRTYAVAAAGRKAKPARKVDLIVREDLIENRYLRAVIGKNGTIISLFDKENQREFADPDRSPFAQKGMNNIMQQPDRGDLWTPYTGPTNGGLLYTTEYRDPMAPSGIEVQRKGHVGCGSADADAIWWPTIKVVEAGPLRAVLEVAYPAPKMTTRICLNRDEKMVRFETRFMPSGKHYRLRVAFPTAIRAGRIRASIPCGFVERGEGEFAAQDWLEYADAKGGLCLLNRGLPGNNVTDNVLILSLFRGVAMEDAETPPWYEDGVEQVFEYALRPFGKKDRDYNPARLGTLFNRSLYPTFVAPEAKAPQMDAVVTLDSRHAEMMAFRRLGKDYELRLCETQGTGGPASVTFTKKVGGCRRTDFLGRALRGSPVKTSGNRLSVELKPFEIVTLRVALT